MKRGAEELKFTPAEYNLLKFFIQNPDRPLTRDTILNQVWGYSFLSNTRTVDAHVARPHEVGDVGGIDCFVEPDLAPSVQPVGEDDECLAPVFSQKSGALGYRISELMPRLLGFMFHD